MAQVAPTGERAEGDLTRPSPQIGDSEAETTTMAMRLAVLILLILGVSEPVGILASWPRLRALGRLTSVSNAPLVFNQVEGFEFWASRSGFTFRDRAARVERLQVTNV